MLLVEDDPATSRALSGIYSRRGWDVVVAMRLADALAALDGGEAPDAVILDLMLPDGDGAAVLERIRSRSLATRVIVTTGVSDPARLAAVQALNPSALLQKPIHLAQLDRHLSA